MVDNEWMVKCVHKMKNLWFRHRKWLVKQGPYFPNSFKQRSLRSFVLYRERRLRDNVPKDMLDGMTDYQKRKYFDKHLYRGRKIRHYDYKVENGSVVLNSHDEKLPKRKRNESAWFDKRGRVRNDVRDALLIKPSSTCRLKGVTPFPLGTQPQKLREVSKKFFEFINQDEESASMYDPEFHERISVSGSWGSQYADFQKLCDPVKHDVTYLDYTRTVSRDGDYLKLPSLPAPTIGDIDFVKTNKKASSGLLTSRLFGLTHRRSDPYNVSIAKRLFELSGKSATCDPSCWLVGGRNRRQKLHVNKILRSRSLLVPEGPVKVFGLVYAQRVYDAFANINWQKFESEIRLGNNDFHGNFLKYDEYMRDPNAVFVESDISCHDGNTTESAMVIAWGILRSMFPKSHMIDQHFFYFMSGFIFKNVATPGRFIYRVLKGIPTGSPFTSIIVSLVNWLNWRAFLYDEGLSQRTRSLVHVFGDDTLVKFDNVPLDMVADLSEDGWKTRFKKFIGHDLDPVHIRTWSDDRDTAPTFLKTYSNFGLPARHFRDTMLSATIIKPSNDTYTRYANIIKGLAYAAPFDFKGLEFLERFRRFLLTKASSQRQHQFDDDVGLTEREINKRIAITYKALSTSFLLPIFANFEIPKNVDNGNKPKGFVTPGLCHVDLVNSTLNTNLYHVHSLSPKRYR